MGTEWWTRCPIPTFLEFMLLWEGQIIANHPIDMKRQVEIAALKGEEGWCDVSKELWDHVGRCEGFFP